MQHKAITVDWLRQLHYQHPPLFPQWLVMFPTPLHQHFSRDRFECVCYTNSVIIIVIIIITTIKNVKVQRSLLKEPHCRSAEVLHALSTIIIIMRDFTVLPAHHTHVHLPTNGVNHNQICLRSR